MRAAARWLPALALVLGAAHVVHFRLEEGRGGLIPANDVYVEFYPNMLYALRSLWHGGRGLLWNPLHNCGQPFFAMPDVGLLHPPNVLFLLLESRLALRGVLLFDLIVAGVATYLLCRELGVGRVAALGGALAFELGNAMASVSAWTPMASGPLAWLPAAMLCCERLLRRPTGRRAAALALVLGVALLPGYPQAVFFAYQLMALRVLWELATRPDARRVRLILAVAGAFVLGPLVAGIQLLPSLETTFKSVRSGALQLFEVSPQGFLDWQKFRELLGLRDAIQNPLVVVPCVVSVAALGRRHAIFYLVTGLLYFALAFGPNTPLFALYMHLPFGALFREPTRLLWLSSFSLAVLTALGVEAVTSSRSRWGPGALVGALAMLLGFRFLSPTGLLPLEWAFASLAIGAGVLAHLVPRARRAAGALACAAVVLNLTLVPGNVWQYLLATDAPLFTHASLFERLRARMTPQDRVFIAGEIPFGVPVFSLSQKTGALFGVPSNHDYEPALSQRYAELFVMLRTGQPMRNLNDAYIPLLGWMPDGFNRRLLDLTAARYLVVSAKVDRVAAVLAPPPSLIDDEREVRVYENPTVLPRASWVPRVAAVPDSEALLQRLASGADDLRQVALVERLPASGFAGEVGDARGDVSFVRDDPEHVTIRVDAPARGFLFLADQHFPGWTATVSGAPAPILRANHAFRLVEVPAGTSVVDLRYRPWTVPLGAVVSALAVLTVGVMLRAGSSRREAVLSPTGAAREPASPPGPGRPVADRA